MNAPWLRAVSRLLALVTFALVAAGCGPRWTVLQEAVPDPFLNRRQFFIEPVHADNILVGDVPEGAYLAEKSPEQQASWRGDKADMIAHYAEGLIAAGEGLQFMTQPSPATFIVRPIVGVIEPGFYAYVAGHSTELLLRVELLDPGGQVLDAIALHIVIPAGMGNAASGTRMRQAAEEAGRVTAAYLATRVFR